MRACNISVNISGPSVAPAVLMEEASMGWARACRSWPYRRAVGLISAFVVVAGFATIVAAPAYATTIREAIVQVANAELNDSSRNFEWNNDDCTFYSGQMVPSWPSCGPAGWGGGEGDGRHPWCANFARWVWQHAGVTDLEGLGTYADSFMYYGGNKGTWHNKAGYVPQPGDAVVFDWDLPGHPDPDHDPHPIDHVAIVTSATESIVYTIGGNEGDPGKVRAASYNLSYLNIVGYASPVGASNASGASTGLTVGSLVQDFSGDGHVDLTWRDAATKDLYLIRGDGASGWLNGGQSTFIGGFGIADLVFSAGDFNGDGHGDVMWRNATSKDLYLMLGDGSGGWLNGGQSTFMGGFGIADLVFSAGDFNGDGHPDVMWRNATTKDLYLIAGDGSIGWLNGGQSTFIGGFGIADMVFSPGDFNGDGHPDVMWRNATTKDLYLIAGDGTGALLNGGQATFIGGYGIADMIIGGDLSGDGHADVIWRNATTKDLYLVAGDGSGGLLNGGQSTFMGGFGIADCIL
jgi:hypothetical protein